MKKFFIMDNEARTVVSKWYPEARRRLWEYELDESVEIFVNTLETALSNINYDYSISVVEPSLDEKGNLCLETGKKAALLTAPKWEKKAQEFAPGAHLATLEELVLFYAYRCAAGYWSLDQIFGLAYLPIPDLKKRALTGAYEVAGFCDGVGNTTKIVRSREGGFCQLGFNWRDFRSCVGTISEMDIPDEVRGSGVIVLK